jgi:uncharacterized protein involved in exopolysaccharide biosynthesis
MDQSSGDLSFKEVIAKLTLWIRYFSSKWLVLSLFGLAGALIGVFIALNNSSNYTAKLSFVLSSESKGGSISGLASQFGFDLGNNSNDIFTGDNILTLFQSKKMVQRALFKTPPEQNDLLVNLITKTWGWDKKWEKQDRLKNAFPFPKDTSKITPTQDSLISEIYNRIIEKNLSVSRPDKKLSVYLVRTSSTNETFSCYLTRFLMYETAKFYIETKTSIQRQNLQMLQKEADSLRRLLGYSITSTASNVDATYNLNPALQVQRSAVQKGQVNTTVLGTAYGEVVKNLELAKINLQKETPLYQIVDEPTIPLKLEKLSKSKALFFGLFIGGIVGVVFLACWRLLAN